jgi:hypothetical protein
VQVLLINVLAACASQRKTYFQEIHKQYCKTDLISPQKRGHSINELLEGKAMLAVL